MKKSTKYYVVSKYRGFITLADLNNQLLNPKVELETFKEFKSYSDASEFLKKSFFDDSDYAVFALEDKTWYRLFLKLDKQRVK